MALASPAPTHAPCWHSSAPPRQHHCAPPASLAAHEPPLRHGVMTCSSVTSPCLARAHVCITSSCINASPCHPLAHHPRAPPSASAMLAPSARRLPFVLPASCVNARVASITPLLRLCAPLAPPAPSRRFTRTLHHATMQHRTSQILRVASPWSSRPAHPCARRSSRASSRARVNLATCAQVTPFVGPPAHPHFRLRRTPAAAPRACSASHPPPLRLVHLAPTQLACATPARVQPCTHLYHLAHHARIILVPPCAAHRMPLSSPHACTHVTSAPAPKQLHSMKKKREKKNCRPHPLLYRGELLI